MKYEVLTEKLENQMLLSEQEYYAIQDHVKSYLDDILEICSQFITTL